MAANVTYWLKLKEDFFADPRIKKLRRIAGGDTYAVILLKLMLLTVKSDGVIVYEGIENTLASELALKIDEDSESVRFVLEYASKHGMLEGLEQGKYFLPYAAENIKSNVEIDIEDYEIPFESEEV